MGGAVQRRCLRLWNRTQRVLKENVSVLPMGDVLCLAEGEGRNAVFLATTGRRVSSVDLTEAGVAKTLRLAVAAECQ